MFKKISTKVLILLMILTMSVTNFSAQERIRFARGRSSATVSGSLAFNYYKTYVLRARAGQSIAARVTSGTGQVVFAEDYEKKYFLDLVEDGDYTIEIMNTGPATWYRLTVSVTRTPR